GRRVCVYKYRRLMNPHFSIFHPPTGSLGSKRNFLSTPRPNPGDLPNPAYTAPALM
ncbi:hypothetical protein PISMIDRAFT_685170, partial [Pisolithus microcarpus 441]